MLNRDEVNGLSVICGFKAIAEAAGLTETGARMVALRGGLPVVFLGGRPLANREMLEAFRKDRASKRERVERNTALTEAIEA